MHGPPQQPAARALAVVVSLAFFAQSGCGRTGNEAAPKPAPPALPSAGEVGDGSAAVDREGGPAPAARALHHLVVTGQSLADGTGGVPALSTTQPYDNRMFATGVRAGGTNLTAFLPLVEETQETLASSLANFIAKGARATGASHDMLVSIHAVGGAPYRLVKKGTAPYAVSLAQVAAARSVARESGLAHDVTAVASADGGGDHVDKNTHLATDLAEWQRDLETDIKAITGQTTPVPLFNTQYSSWTEYAPTSPVPLAQLRAHVDNPGKVIVVGPRYALPYGSDGVHLTNEGYRLMGEQYAKAYRRVVVEKGTWEPLRPDVITRAGAVITVRFLVPAPPLVFDTILATDPGNLGFEYADEGPTTPVIASVALAGPDTVTITLSAEPSGGNRRIRYAFTGVQGAKGGLRTGARGNLRDSDAMVSRYGYPLFDWCVHFDEPVP